jgi:threonine/homoserine/homoserine lactone efflux protein
VLSLAVGVSLSPVPIIAVVLMLATPRARANGPAFLVGWIAGLLVVGGVIVAVSGGADASDGGGPATWVSWLKIVLGLLLLGVALKTWRGRPSGGEGDLPAWMQTIDTFTPPKAFGMGALLSGVNPKNLLLTVGAAAAIAQTDASGGAQAGALVVFAVVGTVGPGIPLAIYFGLGDRAATVLDGLKGWMARNNAVIMVVLCLVIAAKLIGDGVSGLG